MSVHRLLVLLAVLAWAVSGCAHSSSPSASTGARAAGAVLIIGGPCCHAPWPVRGTVHVAGPVVTSVRTDEHGQFSVRLPAGRYRFSATSSSMDHGRDVCTAPRPVSLEPDRTVHVRVVCAVP